MITLGRPLTNLEGEYIRRCANDFGEDSIIDYISAYFDFIAGMRERGYSLTYDSYMSAFDDMYRLKLQKDRERIQGMTVDELYEAEINSLLCDGPPF